MRDISAHPGQSLKNKFFSRLEIPILLSVGIFVKMLECLREAVVDQDERPCAPFLFENYEATESSHHHVMPGAGHVLAHRRSI